MDDVHVHLTASLLPKCAHLRSEHFDVNANSWFREIWWNLAACVYTKPDGSKQAGGKTQIHFFSEGLN